MKRLKEFKAYEDKKMCAIGECGKKGLGGKNTDQDDLREKEGRKIKETAARRRKDADFRGTYRYGLMWSEVDRCAMHGFFCREECKNRK